MQLLWLYSVSSFKTMQTASENTQKNNAILKAHPYAVTNFPFILEAENNIPISEEKCKSFFPFNVFESHRTFLSQTTF